MTDKKRELWHPFDGYSQADLRAVQAVVLYAQGAEIPWPAGEEPPAPSPMDVKRMLDLIVHNLAQTYDNGFAANDSNGRIAAFIDGRQSVGQQLVKLMKLKPALLDRDKQ